MLIHRVIDYLDDARAYISKRALHKRENDELWALHFHWNEYKAELCSQLLSQTFVFSPIREDTLPSHQVVRYIVLTSWYKKPWHWRWLMCYLALLCAFLILSMVVWHLHWNTYLNILRLDLALRPMW